MCVCIGVRVHMYILIHICMFHIYLCVCLCVCGRLNVQSKYFKRYSWTPLFRFLRITSLPLRISYFVNKSDTTYKAAHIHNYKFICVQRHKHTLSHPHICTCTHIRTHMCEHAYWYSYDTQIQKAATYSNVFIFRVRCIINITVPYIVVIAIIQKH